MKISFLELYRGFRVSKEQTKQNKMAKNDHCVSAFIGFFMFLWGGTAIGLLSWGANWINSEGDDLSDSIRVWTILAVAGSMFTYAGLLFGGICTAVGAEDAAKTVFGCGGSLGTAGFVGACGCIDIWRTFDGLDSKTEKMVGLISFTGISILFFFAFLLVLICTLPLLAACMKCCEQKSSHAQQTRGRQQPQQHAHSATAPSIVDVAVTEPYNAPHVSTGALKYVNAV